MASYTTGTGQVLHNVHPCEFECDREGCVIHNPTAWNQHWPTNWGQGRMERLCPCGVGHPDPDDLQYRTRVSTGPSWSRFDIHHCCSKFCCEQGRMVNPESRFVKRLRHRVELRGSNRRRVACTTCRTVLEVRRLHEFVACPCGGITIKQEKSFVRLWHNGLTTRLVLGDEPAPAGYTDPHTVLLQWPDKRVTGHTPEEYAALVARCLVGGRAVPARQVEQLEGHEWGVRFAPVQGF